LCAEGIQYTELKIHELKESFKPTPTSQAKAAIWTEIHKNNAWMERLLQTYTEDIAKHDAKIAKLQKFKAEMVAQEVHAIAVHHSQDTHHHNLLALHTEQMGDSTPLPTSVAQPPPHHSTPAIAPELKNLFASFQPHLQIVGPQIQQAIPGPMGTALSVLIVGLCKQCQMQNPSQEIAMKSVIEKGIEDYASQVGFDEGGSHAEYLAEWCAGSVASDLYTNEVPKTGPGFVPY
jgi:hypothetical protein